MLVTLKCVTLRVKQFLKASLVLTSVQKSIAKFDEALTGAKTVVWNGPMGVFENPDFQAGTIGVMDAIVNNQVLINHWWW